MKYSLLDELKEEYKNSLDSKMSWAKSQVDLVYKLILQYVEREASVGNSFATISLDIIQQHLEETVSKDDGYFIVQSFISKFESDGYYKVFNKKRLSFSLYGWDVPWVFGLNSTNENRNLYNSYRSAIMDSDNSFEKCRILFLEHIYSGIKDCCINAKDSYTENLNFRVIFKDKYSDYVSMSGADIGKLFNKIRKDIEESGIEVNMLTYNLILLGGWSKKDN